MSAGLLSGAYKKKLPSAKTAYVIDFFCGCGGMSAGLASTRQSHLQFEILAGLDIRQDALKTYEHNVGAPGLNVDVEALASNPDKLRDLIPGWNPEAMRPLVFVGCPPCQGFSALRKGDERDDERNSLSAAFAKIVAHFRPDIVVMENVPEILKGRFAHHFEKAIRRMSRIGYKFEKNVFDMSLFGIPQKRRRALVMGALDRAPALPVAVLEAARARTVRQAIGHLPPLAAGEVDEWDPLHRAPAHTERMVEMFKKIPADGGDRRDLPKEYRLSAHERLDAGDSPGFTDVYGRLRWDLPSVTITAKSRSPSSGRFLHPEQHRNLTVREAALLQGFPHSYQFAGTPTQQYRQIGEAVPPLFARFIGWAILGHLSPMRRTPPAFSKKLTHSRSSDTLVSIDCFCGAGGLGLGFAAAGVLSKLAFDTDEAAVETYSKNLAPVARRLSVESPALRKLISSVVGGQRYCLIGGPPCQGFSHQRKGETEDPRNELVLRYAELAIKAKKKPEAIILENVTDLDLPRGKHILAAYEQMLAAAGYVCFRHDLNSADFGVPQLRNRIIVVALPERAASFYRAPRPLTAARWMTVGECFVGLPSPSAEIPNHQQSAEGAENRRRIAFVDMGKGRKSIPDDLQLPCHSKSYRGHRDVFGRLDWFSQARTLTAGFDSFTRGEYAHPFEHRSITSREAARIQGFPDWFQFYGNRADVRRQIGNAVPPPLAYAVAKAVKAAIERGDEAQWAA